MSSSRAKGLIVHRQLCVWNRVRSEHTKAAGCLYPVCFSFRRTFEVVVSDEKKCQAARVDEST
jgi:hypothetical protein